MWIVDCYNQVLETFNNVTWSNKSYKST